MEISPRFALGFRWNDRDARRARIFFLVWSAGYKEGIFSRETKTLVLFGNQENRAKYFFQNAICWPIGSFFYPKGRLINKQDGMLTQLFLDFVPQTSLVLY